MRLPPDVVVYPDIQLLVWKPRGLLDEKSVNALLRFVTDHEAASETPFDRFTDTTGLDAIDLNFNYVFHVALYRRLTFANRPRTKSAFLIDHQNSAHYVKLHAVLTDHSPLEVRIFEDREAAAQWLGIPSESLQAAIPG